MNKLSDAIRMALDTTMSDREIAAALAISKTTVRRYRRMAQEKGLFWHDLAGMSPRELDATFYKKPGLKLKKRLPDFAMIHQELDTKGVTLELLWEEYRAPSPDDALSYPQFTHHYRVWAHQLHPVMRQHHCPGEKVFVDYSGKRPCWRDANTGHDHFVELFVAALGTSSKIFAFCSPTQSIPDWIDASVRMFEFYGGVPHIIVPDNLKAAVEKPGRVPTIQRTYLDFARHYGVAIIPARTYRPRDKAKAEQSVQMAQRWILACLRHETFFSLADLNARVSELLDKLNRRPYKRLEGCRHSRFEALDQPALRPLPVTPYEFAEWVSRQKVPNDYHIAIKGHYYSVPHELIGRVVEARVTLRTVEIFSEQVRIASHERDDTPGGYATTLEHQPESHRAQAARTPAHLLTWSTTIGPNTEELTKALFNRRLPALGLPAAEKLQSLGRKYGTAELEAAAKRALELKSPSATTVTSLLRSGLHRQRATSKPIQGALPMNHANVRGSAYYSGSGESSC